MVQMVQTYEVVKITSEKWVKPDGHVKATHGRELHLNELAFNGSMKVIP
jgi:hypothetical protein